jgi:hypothetical protein
MTDKLLRTRLFAASPPLQSAFHVNRFIHLMLTLARTQFLQRAIRRMFITVSMG